MNSTYQDWLNARENARQAIEDVEREGEARAQAEAEYYRCKATDYARLVSSSNATAAGNQVKGQGDTNAALYRYRLAEAKYKAATLAANLFIDEEAHCYQEHRIAMSGDRER